ncbi:hypothetical protein [Roseobacter sp. OBYS 0001]|uniref:hypothetical protein n=1 Tax=Roseobacter sp. OBYS 0001 TaxID=882651 RepID=UPI001BB9EC20|nr:hypothetical protein [Roseobacter sp. OBYS 0001]GIT85446.1 hypothetical protein ROBYS_04620 [Roseobacter sp. OBYS 0001]
MPKGPNGQKRPADAIGCAVSVARIATGEDEDTGYVSRNRRKSGVAGAKARTKNLDAEQRSEIATRAAEARWKMESEMTEMTFDQRFQKAFDGGLADIKFFVRRDASVTPDALRSDALAFQEAIDCGNVKEVGGVD